MTTDPNWLPSTVAQSTAVLVAIVGGFLVSRLVTLSSERGALLHRRAELAKRLELSRAVLDDVYTERLSISLAHFRDHYLETFVDQRGKVDVEAAVADFIPVGSSKDEMRHYAEELAEQVREAFERIEQAMEKDSELPTGDLDLLRSEVGEIADDQADIYRHVGHFLDDEFRRRVGLPSMGSFRRFQSLVESRRESTVRAQRQDARIAREADLRGQVTALEAEIHIIDEQAGRFARPRGVPTGIAVLAFFALVGVIFPMVVMATRPVPSDWWMRLLLVLAFVLGFVALLIYLIVYLQGVRLHNESRTDNTPNSQGG